ncbi:hypothetical protein EKE94_14825 [Mesobaculum littorinae]|uniref:Uncharacterized protein n=1 Tax=Mesobaculum littorinae TaxID=2486419 RepID=A0A438AEZ8_9RHOB|nr:hypothetical protein [Mesobaculum littorinae]RVV97283.1 hypothetical protein EKE94_14825 [Mesobaculum littorinae]
MRYPDLAAFLKHGRAALSRGPVALIMAEDAAELDGTIRHHEARGFRAVVVFAPDALAIDAGIEARIHRVSYDTTADAATERAVNAVIEAAPGIWLYYGYNAEYLFHPFCETRSVGEMLAFHTEERRDAMLTYVVDLYPSDLGAHPGAVAPGDAWLDKSGYYALARLDPVTKHPLERQLDFFGGLRWRFEEHVPRRRRRIDRVALFRARPGLRLGADHTFNDPEYNTYACPWHHNLTAAICSFRTAKALATNAGSRDAVSSFHWGNSTRFEWHSRQLMELGLMEPGQWF